MKTSNPLKLIAFIALTVSLTAAVIDWTKPQRRTLLWEDTNNPPEITFNVYTSAVVTVPLTQWNLMTNIAATNILTKSSNGTNYYAWQFDQIPQNQFFVVRTYSLFYGQESDFSNVTNTPAPPSSPRVSRIN